MPDSTVLSCTGLCKSFDRMIVPTVMIQDKILRWRKHRQQWNMQALKDVSFSMKQGEWIGIYGPNGCGKTTLIRILGGLMPQDSGDVTVHGNVCCLFAFGTGFHMERSAEENIYFHGLLHGIPAAEVKRTTDEIIRFAGVETHRQLPIKCYSNGMRARLAFAAATKINADLYLLDEVLAVGDVAFQQKCWGYFEEMRAAGKSVVMVSHEEPHLQRFCDRIIYMDKGVIQRIVSTREPEVPAIFLHDAEESGVPALVPA